MKKTIALLLVLVLSLGLLAGCGRSKAPAVPAATAVPAEAAVPTPEPTEESRRVPMSGVLTDVLEPDQQDFLSTVKSDPPAMAAIYLDGQYPMAVELDIDTVRDICTALSEIRICAKTSVSVSDEDNTLSLARNNGESITLHFMGDQLAVCEEYYELEDADEFWDLLAETAQDAQEEAAENLAELESGQAYNATYDKDSDSNLIRCVSAPAELNSSGDGWQTVDVKLTVTNLAQHLLMSAKCIAKYVDSEGRVIASVPVDMDFNQAPVYIGEAREYTLSQKLTNVTGADLSGGQLLAVGAMIEVVSVNAPDEAGH